MILVKIVISLELERRHMKILLVQILCATVQEEIRPLVGCLGESG